MKQRVKSLSIHLSGAVVAVFLISGCASDNHFSEMADLRKQLYELQRAQGIQASKIEELNNQILLMKDKVDKNSASTEAPGEIPPPPLQQPVQKVEQPTVTSTVPPPVKAAEDSSQDDETDSDDSDQTSAATDSKKSVDTHDSEAGDDAEPTVDLQPLHPQSGASASGAPEKIYGQALADSKKSSPVALEKDVNLLLKNYKESPLTNNALFLLAETLYGQQQYSSSAAQYERLYKMFPDGNKAVAALYRLGLCYQKMGRANEAKEAFQNVMTVYPGSREALDAEKILNKDGNNGT